MKNGVITNGIVTLRETLHNKVLVARSLEYVISQPMFERLWNDSNTLEKEKAQKLIDKLDREGIQLWIRGHRSVDIAEMSVRRLYDTARKLGIKNYSRLAKDELVAAIKRTESRELQ